MNILNDNFWLIATSISAITLPITTMINSKFNVNNVWKQIIAWSTSIILTILSYFLGLITFNEPTWLTVPLTGLVCGLSANGIYDIPTIKNFINNYFKLIPLKE